MSKNCKLKTKYKNMENINEFFKDHFTSLSKTNNKTHHVLVSKSLKSIFDKSKELED